MIVSITMSSLLYADVYPYLAMIKVPIADLLGESITHFGLHKNQAIAYQHIPLSWGPSDTDKDVCPRIHQALLHQLVMVHEKNNAEVKITLDSAYYLSKKTNELSNSYWTLESNIIPVSELALAGISLNYLPESLHQDIAKRTRNNFNTVTLMYPFHDHLSNTFYSAGTRFIYQEEQARSYTAFAFDGKRNQLHLVTLPKKICYHATGYVHSHKRQEAFVALLHEWSNNKNGFIPLVWGGCSFQYLCNQDQVQLGKKTMLDGRVLAYWHRIGYNQVPFSGFDASNLILLAAQIVDIPYFYKNSTTALANLNKVTSYSQLREGDLLWLNQGIAVVASLERNTLITVFSYTLGYGKVVELPLSRVFEGITSWRQLFDSQDSLTLLDARGQTARPIKNWQLLSLQSVFNKSGNF